MAGLLGLLAFLVTVVSGCAHGADASRVLGRSLLVIPIFFIAGWMAGRWMEKISASSEKAREAAEAAKREQEASEAGVEGEAR